MAALRTATVGILPPGALGVSFFYHLSDRGRTLDGSVTLIERSGSASAGSLRAAGELVLAPLEGEPLRLSTERILQSDLLAVQQQGELPEVLLVCPNPDQLLGVVTTLVALIAAQYRSGESEATGLLPLVVFSANGIYFQRLRQLFIEKLEEAVLFKQLPELDPTLMEQVVGRLMRGVTMQTGLREGAFAETVYRPGPPGQTRIAGGDPASQVRSRAILAGRGGWFDLESSATATRIEFDKAVINLNYNALGLLYSVDEAGRFHPLTVGEVFQPAHLPEICELTRRVYEVGLSVGAYNARDSYEALFERVSESAGRLTRHVPSSLQWVGLMLECGKLEAKLPPTETWLLDPLIYYANTAGLEETVVYFEELRRNLVAKLTSAIGAMRVGAG